MKSSVRRLGNIRTKLPELTIGDYQRAEGLQPLGRLGTALFLCFFVDGESWTASSFWLLQVLHIPQELLDQVAFIFDQQQVSRIGDNLFNVIGDFESVC